MPLTSASPADALAAAAAALGGLTSSGGGLGGGVGGLYCGLDGSAVPSLAFSAAAMASRAAACCGLGSGVGCGGCGVTSGCHMDSCYRRLVDTGVIASPLSVVRRHCPCRCRRPYRRRRPMPDTVDRS